MIAFMSPPIINVSCRKSMSLSLSLSKKSSSSLFVSPYIDPIVIFHSLMMAQGVHYGREIYKRH